MKILKKMGVILFICLWVNSPRAEEGFAPSPDAVKPLLVGQILPALSLPSADGNTFDLQAENKKKPLVVVFYRGHW